MSKKGSPAQERRSERPALQAGPRRFGDTGQTPGQQRKRFLALAIAVSAHLIVFAALLWPYAAPPRAKPSLAPLMVSLVEQPKPKPPNPPDETKVEVPQNFVQPTAPRVSIPVLAAPTTPTIDTSDLLSDSQLAGAASAGEGGGGGGGCDTARAVQQALRRDPLVRTAVEEAHRLGKAIMLWNGDWVQSGDQDGKGLSAAREAIVWAVAFAPASCRNERMHGLVLLSLEDRNTRFAIGTGEWRWADLLGIRGAAPDR